MSAAPGSALRVAGGALARAGSGGPTGPGHGGAVSAGFRGTGREIVKDAGYVGLGQRRVVARGQTERVGGGTVRP